MRPPKQRALTYRERQVLTLVAEGMSNQQISRALHITLNTTKTHLGRISWLLGTRRRSGLVGAAFRLGLITWADGRVVPVPGCPYCGEPLPKEGFPCDRHPDPNAWRHRLRPAWRHRLRPADRRAAS